MSRQINCLWLSGVTCWNMWLYQMPFKENATIACRLHFIRMRVGGMWVTLYGLHICWHGPAPLDEWTEITSVFDFSVVVILIFVLILVLVFMYFHAGLLGSSSWIRNRLLIFCDPCPWAYVQKADVGRVGRRCRILSSGKLQPVCFLCFAYAQPSVRKGLVDKKNTKFLPHVNSQLTCLDSNDCWSIIITCSGNTVFFYSC